MRGSLGRRVDRLEDKFRLCERGRAEREASDRGVEEINELLRQREEYKHWLEEASVEELQKHLAGLEEEYRRRLKLPVEEKYIAEEIAVGLPRYEDVLYENQRSEVERVIRRRLMGWDKQGEPT